MTDRSCGPAGVIGVCSAGILTIMLITQGIVGFKYIGSCPGQPFIPVYLAAMGGSILLFSLKEWNVFCFSVVSVFYFVWFIAGNVCIYSLYNYNYRNCDNTLYLFAFWSTSFTYVLLGVMFCSLRCKQIEPDTDAQMPVPV